ncbi:hypothetical protein [Deinococcus aquaedulcis]|uniref:hypothetical protein n=1 Tax=Deinococcus aquaedulcis TaxID=2840455 RepID=UPI001C83BAC9|nr:hypothetical protein [Deinococcus aquaedulcis]
MNAPAWRVWLVTALVIGWALLTFRFVQTAQWPMAGLCFLLLISNAVTLWRLTQRGR